MRLSERRALLVAATMVALFSGCTVGPNYKTPEIVPPPTYSAEVRIYRRLMRVQLGI